MSNREKLPELIDRYNNGELSGDELTAFLEMLKASPRLRKEVKLDSDLNKILADSDILELRKVILSVQKNRKKRKGPDLQIILLAASLLLLIGIEVFLFMNYPQHNPSIGNKIISKNQPVLKQPVQKIKIENQITTTETENKGTKNITYKKEAKTADNFRENLSFENIIGATRHAGSFRMVAPAMGAHFSEKATIVFKWTPDKQAKIELKIMDNSGSGVHESGSLDQSDYSLAPGTLKQGLYYYKVMQKDEIIFFGKFIVD
jgi:hypothetical protein